MNIQETIINDGVKRNIGNSRSVDRTSKMIINQKKGVIEWYDNDGNLIGEFGILDSNRFGLRVLDETDNRFFIGKDSDFYGYKMSRPATDVFDNNDEDLLLSSNTSYVQLQFSTFVGSPNATSSDFTGFILYDNSSMVNDVNFALRLDFYKPSNIILTEVQLETTFYDGLTVYGGASRLVDIDEFLNPTKTLVSSGSFNYYRYSIGTGKQILSLYDPTKDEDRVQTDFTSDQINAINDGWNSIVVQKNTSSSTIFGYALINIVLIGYKIHS